MWLQDLAGAIATHVTMQALAPGLYHGLAGCNPGLIFRKRCSRCGQRIVKGDTPSGWMPDPNIAGSWEGKFPWS